MFRIESLLSARNFISPRLVDGKIYFISDMSGRYSLYRMNYGGSVPEPLLPPHIALFNPKLGGGKPFMVFPELGKILVMIDKDGDEATQPMIIPMEGGFPEPAFNGQLEGNQVVLLHSSPEHNLVYLSAGSLTESMFRAYQGNIEANTLESMGQSAYGNFIDSVSEDHTQAVLADALANGDIVLYRWRKGHDRELFYGKPIDQRAPGEQVPLNNMGNSQFLSDNRALLLITTLFEDNYGLGYLSLDGPSEVVPVTLTGTKHTGRGEMSALAHLEGDRYTIEYNIDGCSWLYEGVFDEGARTMTLDRVVCGQGTLSSGVLHSHHYDTESTRYVLSFSTASTPTQLYTVEGKDRKTVVQHTAERVLGVPDGLLSDGEDASYTSFDGLRVSARLYMPAEKLGYEGKRPVVYYIHGGPQGQERPDFSWFSMPIIQFLTLNGFAVFVPNVRGSTGYGFSYSKRVERDWGGKDVLDHMHSLDLLSKDERLDTSRAGVTGRSYGGYMTLMLASRYPDRWAAAVDMFGPYDLITNMQRMPITWRPFFASLIGDPDTEADFLRERSPSSYIENLKAPLMVLQGAHDSRVTEADSRDLVEHLRSTGKEVEFIVFENEGHDVTRMENRVRAYNAITDFFKEHLRP
nr:Prolyl oligopeptidase family [uncultured bacterium]